MTKVIFRKFRSVGDIIALFPEELATYTDYSIACYQHIGQHGAADYELVINMTVPAPEAEYADLLAELKSIGYDDLRVMKKCRPNYAKLIREFNERRNKTNN